MAGDGGRKGWREDKFYDRFGLDEETVNILGIDIPIITIPVQPGRNLATIVEGMVGASAWDRYSMTLVVKATVVSAVCSRVRWCFRAMDRHSG